MSLKEKLNVIHRSARKERGMSCHAMPGHRRKHRCQEAQRSQRKAEGTAFLGVSARKAGQSK